ncbi:hypothetical protein Aazo_1515 ['Nostoc azollae' 0708]|uniref:Uncharacterized protein n=1 Tax=Nostoc azollae (strain 0708) TaxID=551115 RepID=D7E4G1_NOSA0|nr:hypothetical protein Aazo_1515 ['Nostoc azollae' 0708]
MVFGVVKNSEQLINRQVIERLLLAMTQSRKTNRDYTKKKHRLLVEDQVIAEQLSGLLTPTITNQEN